MLNDPPAALSREQRMTANSGEPPSPDVAARLGQWDAISIIVGIVVGTGIFILPQQVFTRVEGPWIGMARDSGTVAESRSLEVGTPARSPQRAAVPRWSPWSRGAGVDTYQRLRQNPLSGSIFLAILGI